MLSLPEIAPSCSREEGLRTMALTLLAYSAVTILSRLLTPLAFPATTRAMRKERGALAYWDASLASMINGAVSCTVAVRAYWLEPGLLASDDAFASTPLSCSAHFMFLAWLSFIVG